MTGGAIDPVPRSPRSDSQATAPVKPNCPLLPANTVAKGTLTVVLDLDETLVHAHPPFGDEPADALIVRSLDHRDFCVNVRPHAATLLRTVADKCEGVLWTRASVAYGAVVAAELDTCSAFRHRVFRDWRWEQDRQKHLARLGRSLNRTLLVDDAVPNALANPGHTVLVPEYYINSKDTALLVVAELVSAAAESELAVPEFLAASPLVELREVRKGCPSVFHLAGVEYEYD